jgi:hypothetical protein
VPQNIALIMCRAVCSFNITGGFVVCVCVFLLLLSVRAAHTIQKCRVPIYIFCSVDSTSRCNRVKKNQLHAQLLVYFVNLYMYGAYLGPSSGGTTVCIQLVLIILCFRGWIGTPIQPGQQTVI